VDTKVKTETKGKGGYRGRFTHNVKDGLDWGKQEALISTEPEIRRNGTDETEGKKMLFSENR